MAEMLMQVVLEGFRGVCRIGGITNNPEYVNDVVLLVSSAQEPQELISRVDQASANYGLQINVCKFK